MKTLPKVIGINVLVLFVYMIILGMGAKLTLLSILLLPMHVTVCIFLAIVYYVSPNPDEADTSTYSKAYLLSAVVVVFVGFSTCSLMLQL